MYLYSFYLLIMKSMKSIKDLTFIDLFAGAGGFSEGFIREGYKSMAHIEMDSYACSTLKTRMSYHYLKDKGKIKDYEKYVEGQVSKEELYELIPEHILNSVINEEITEYNLDSLFKKIIYNLDNYGYDSVDLIVGGPPCQAYSIVGRSRDPHRMEDDSRNYLYKLYLRFIKFFKPSILVFENVPGLISAGNGIFFQDLKTNLQNLGYSLGYDILNAKDYGVLQNRKRVILIGWSKDLCINFHNIKKVDNYSYNVRDLFSDLPPIEPGEKVLCREYSKNPSDYLIRNRIRDNGGKLIQHITRNHNERDRQIYRMAIEKWKNELKRLSYSDVPTRYRTHKNVESFLDRYKVVADDLPYCHTLVAHVSKDGHYYIHPDKNQARSLSVRETARIQSFPDDYLFEGPMTSNFRQIGNAVPPLMAEKISHGLKLMLND